MPVLVKRTIPLLSQGYFKAIVCKISFHLRRFEIKLEPVNSLCLLGRAASMGVKRITRRKLGSPLEIARRGSD
jgi:hypothetical protein